MEDKQVKIGLRLLLTSSNMTPERLSDELGVLFDDCHRIGEMRGRNLKVPKYWETNWWIIREEAEVNFADANDRLPVLIDRLLSRVEVRWEIFTRLSSPDHGTLSVVLVSNGYPGMGLSSDLLSRIARLNLYMDFDLYCDSECEKVHLD